MEYEVPWLMVNGKPAPGFAALKWGRAITKEGKSRFDAPQNRAVANALQHISWIRKHQDTPDLLAAIIGGPFSEYVTELKRSYKRYATLPPLSRKTRAQWWPLVREIIRNTAKLSPDKKKKLADSADYETDSAILNEYVKRCRRAFYALCPAK